MYETMQFIHHVHSLSIWIESYEYPFSTVYHIEIIIPQFFILGVIPCMTKLISLNAKKRCTNQFPMINTTPMGAITLSCVQWFVMYESFKIIIDCIANPDFLRVCVNDFASFIGWEQLLETCCTISIICS